MQVSDTYSDERPKKQRDICEKLTLLKDTVYTDQTENFTVCSRQVIKYTMFLFAIDGN